METQRNHLFNDMADHMEAAKAVIFGAPVDATTSYRPGTRFGPRAMRTEWEGLEIFSPYLNRELDSTLFFDAGDVDIPLGNVQQSLKKIEILTEEILSAGKIPVMLGGEHLVSLPAITSVQRYFPDVHIIHFDAHADLRDEFFGEKLSHATVMRRVWDIVGDNRIHQFGIRSGTREEFNWARLHTKMFPFRLINLQQTASDLRGKPIYLSIDLDVLDPAVFPGTGTPEPGGVFFHELMEALFYLRGSKIVGMDIVELSPHYDASGISTMAACKVLREGLLLLQDRMFK